MAYRILSLDGGGAWSVLQVMALSAIYGEDVTGHDLLRRFDLVAANSGGSIVLGGLLENHTLAALKNDFFLNQEARNSVFAKLDGIDQVVRATAGIGPKYSTTGKLAGLQALLKSFGATPISKLRTAIGSPLPDLMICTFDYDRLRGILFRSNRVSRAASFTDELDPTLAQAIHASSTAPINYFDKPALLPAAAGPRQFWDGGVAGYNNPVMIAVMEALANGHRPADIKALSLGTGTEFLPFDPGKLLGTLGQPSRELPRSAAIADFAADVSTLATAIVDDPPDIASYHAHVALGGAMPADATHVQGAGPVVRMSPMVQPVFDQATRTWQAPAGITDFRSLASLDMDATATGQIDQIVEFGTAWINNTVTNQPIRCNRDTLACEIGQPTFDRAAAVWRDYDP